MSAKKQVLRLSKSSYNRIIEQYQSIISFTKITKVSKAFDAKNFVNLTYSKLEEIENTLTNQKTEFTNNNEFFGEKAFRNMNEVPLKTSINSISNKISTITGDISSIRYQIAKRAWIYRLEDLTEYKEYCNIKKEMYTVKYNYTTSKTNKLKYKDLITKWKANYEIAKKQIVIANDNIRKYPEPMKVLMISPKV